MYRQCQMLLRMQRNWILHIDDGTINWCSHLGKDFGILLKRKKKKLSMSLPHNPAIVLLDTYTREIKTNFI